MAERFMGDPRQAIPRMLRRGRLLGRFPRASLRLERVDTEEFAGVRVIRKIGGREEELGVWGLDRMDGEDIKTTGIERDFVVGMSSSVVRPFWDKLEKSKP